MKKFYSFLFAAAAIVGFAACNSDSTDESVPAQKENVGKMEFMANFGEETKTELYGMSVRWSPEDAIWVNHNKFEIKDKENYEPATTATFTGNAVVEAPYMAIFPYRAYREDSSETCFVVNLNANINIDSFHKSANIAVVYSEDGTNLSFKNVLSVLKFQLSAECDDIEFISTNALVGDFVVDCTTANIIARNTSDDDKTISLTGNFSPGKEYYMTVLPNDSSDTHELTIYINEQLSTTKSPKRLERNKIYNLGILPVPVSDTDAEGAAF